ncbi:DUF4871 domain-containing protein [Xylanibacillus composti]|uniref:DUF4871 domain-containing protein n=1 Tax=Xylanibacillus composti TaxID=1572762 RepID=A0A8J4H7I7_9BACL|nr:DUF4871 domain-containing protein [Xylanibacillus composti]MDT9725682.1 DUF4871 domain-containing protein [Xylanibacillus composti]GIQ71176.1 hypothetical protein XYCOK13_40000 [Xylanibacillus composti]
MTRMRLLCTVLLACLLLTSCSQSESSVQHAAGWEATGEIELSGILGETGEEFTTTWVGLEEKIAISNNPFYAGEQQKYMWLLWGEKEELVHKDFTVTATSEEGEEMTLVESRLGGENWGATASFPSSIALPSAGLWKLDAYVDGSLFSTIVVPVTEK